MSCAPDLYYPGLPGADGSANQGGDGATTRLDGGGGAGGGGYFGGGGGGSGADYYDCSPNSSDMSGGGGGGGGGSSYIAPGRFSGTSINDTPDTQASSLSGNGETIVSYAKPATATTLVASPQIDHAVPSLGAGVGKVRATLTSAGSPVGGALIKFRVGMTMLCTATTNASGIAGCTLSSANQRRVQRAKQYKASFAGNAAYLASSASTPTVV
jgi:hypothetical protein